MPGGAPEMNKIVFFKSKLSSSAMGGKYFSYREPIGR